MAYTTANLLEEIKQRCATPANQITYSDTDFLRLAYEELLSYIVPLFMKIREEYLIREKDYTITSSTTEVIIPDRALGGSLRDVLYVDSAGNTHSVALLDSEQRERIDNSYYQDFMVYLIWDKLKLVGTVAPGTLRVPYYIRPGKLVETSDVGKITNINTSTGELTLDSVPSDFTTSLSYDLISAQGTYPYHSIDLTASAVGASSITFTASDLPSDLAVNDYVVVAGESVLPQIPRELQPLLAMRTVMMVLDSNGDYAARDKAEGEVNKMEERLLNIVSPRVQGEPKKIVTGFEARRWYY